MCLAEIHKRIKSTVVIRLSDRSTLLLEYIYAIFAFDPAFGHKLKLEQYREDYSQKTLNQRNGKQRNEIKRCKSSYFQRITRYTFHPRFELAERKKKKCWNFFSNCACHPCAGAMLIFSVSFQI